MIGAAMILGGVIISILLVREILNKSKLVREGMRASGVVTSVRIHRIRKNDNEKLYLPTVKFQAKDSKIYTFESKQSSNLKEGQKVTVMYYSHNPSIAEIDKGIFNILPLFVTLMISVGFAIWGVIMIIQN